MKQAWESKVSARLRDSLGDALGANKRPPWIEEKFWDDLLKYWDSSKYRTLSKWNKKNKTEGREGEGGRGTEKHTGGSIKP